MPSFPALSRNLPLPSLDAFLQTRALFILTSSAFGIAAASYIAQVPLTPTYELFSHQLTHAPLEDFIKFENSVALPAILQNIGPDGINAGGAAPGIVVASPSKTDPNYHRRLQHLTRLLSKSERISLKGLIAILDFYTWTRDSALTLKVLVEAFIAGEIALQPTIENYLAAQAGLETVSNPSGDLTNGAGLGEPKFNVDQTAFIGTWGRPQRDGPALRVTSLIAYANWLISKDQITIVVSDIWPILANDLAYIGQYWNQTTFDLWEEVHGSSFFTTAVQYRALVEGEILAILCFLQRFWNGKFISANINVNNDRAGKDVNTLLASVYTFDPSAHCDDTTFQPCSPKALANHKAVTDSFRSIYAINTAIPRGVALAVGRYPEDTYQGGNPWYLTTLAAAELLYDALYQYSILGHITITPTSHPFFFDLVPSITVGTYTSSSPIYRTLISAIRNYADGFISVVHKYAPATGLLAEQFSRTDGSPLSAANLTWSYAAFLTATARRKGQVPGSWGSNTSDALPSTCKATSAKGTYAPPCAIATSVAVTFREVVTTTYGENVYISGSVSELGRWDIELAIALSAEFYTAEDPVWDATITLPLNMLVEYKYFKMEQDGKVMWERDLNRVFTVPAGCTGKTAKRDFWR